MSECKYSDGFLRYARKNISESQSKITDIDKLFESKKKINHEKTQPHSHYFKDVSNINQIDVYRVLELFNVTDPVLQHIAKKALCAGERGHKDLERDVQDIFDSAKRKLEMINEDRENKQ